MRRSLVVLPVLVACTGRPDPGEVCTVDDAAITPGRGLGTLDGEPWEPAGVTWIYAGWQLTLVARTDRDGVAVSEAMAAGDFPVHVALSGDDGFATLYPSDGDSLTTTNTDVGDLQLLRLDADNGLVACFSFEAASDAGAANSMA